MSPPITKTTDFVPGYTVKERIGAGGYGEVWKAEAPGGLQKAVKFVYGYLDDERAARELKALQRIKEVRHPFLLSLERIEVIDGQLVMVMELAESSLKDVFEQYQKSGEPGVPREELLVYLGDAADALDYMSESYSLQHLDIKPENLLILGRRVKVADFGLVKDIHDTSMSLMSGLTPVYAPPEVFDGRPSLHSDQYSLAVVYQEMLTGALPFPGRTASQLATQHLHSPPRLAPLSPSDQAAIARALSKDPSQRFPSCRAMIDALLGRGAPASDKGTAVHDEQPAEPDSESDTTSEAFQATEVVERPAPVPTSVGLPPRPASTHTEQFDHGESPPLPPATRAVPEERLTWDTPVKSDVPPDRPIEPAAFPSPLLTAPARELPPIDIEPEACGIRPTLVVGIGGTGARALGQLRRRLRERFGSSTRVPAFRMLLVDTDCKAIAQASQGDAPEAIGPEESIAVPLRPSKDYRSQSKELLAWLSRRWLYNIPRSLRTEGLRPLGRLAFVDHAPELIQRLRGAISSITAPSALADSSANTGLNVRTEVPRVFVLASISGGTGSGMAIDIGYAVRKVLHDLGLPDDGVCGILTHSSGRNPHERDLAAANAYAFLSELNHYAGRSHYPGDSACGLPAFPDNVGPFRDTYVVSLGTTLDEAGFDIAVETLAEYLYLDTATPGGAFFDKCREEGPTDNDVSSAGALLRTFGTWHVGRSLSALLTGAAEALCKRLIRRWRGDPKAAQAQPNAHPSALPAEDEPARTDAGSEADRMDRLANQWAEEHQLQREILVDHALAAMDSRLGDDPDAYFRRLLQPFMEAGNSRKHRTGNGKPGEQILAAIDGVLGASDRPEEPQDEVQRALQTEFERRLEEVGLNRRDAVFRWILKWIDSPDGGAGEARRAAEWFGGHLRSLESEIHQQQEEIRHSLAEMEQTLLAQQWADYAKTGSRFGLGRRSRKTPTAQQQWLDYCRRRLVRLALSAVLSVVRSIAAQVSRVAHLIKELQRELGVIGEAFDESAYQAESNVERGAPAEPLEGVRRRVVGHIRSEMPRLPVELDREVRSEFFGKGSGLCDILTKDNDFRRLLTWALRDAARSVLLRSLGEINVTRLLLCPEDDRTANRGIEAYLEKAAPEPSTCGGGKRLLIVLPEGLEDGNFQDAAKTHLTEPPSVACDPDFDVALCWETGQLPLSTVAATLIDCRVDYAQVASRLHTRVDVSWTRLTDCMHHAPQQ